MTVWVCRRRRLRRRSARRTARWRCGCTPTATVTTLTQRTRFAPHSVSLRNSINLSFSFPSPHQQFKAIGEAYDVLSDPDRRAAYDANGSAGLAARGFQARPAADVFASFFGGRAFADIFPADGAAPAPPAGADIVTALPVTLEELYAGATRHALVCRAAVCPACAGAGCRACGARGTVPQRVRVAVRIEPGMRDGQRVVVPGTGDEQKPPGATPGATTGDAVFVLRTKPHALFVREGADLRLVRRVPLAAALAGRVAVAFPHVSGRTVVAHTPEAHVVCPGETLVLAALGMPVWRRPYRCGDLRVVFDVVFPCDRALAPCRAALLAALAGVQDAGDAVDDAGVAAALAAGAQEATMCEHPAGDTPRRAEAYDDDGDGDEDAQQDYTGSSFDASRCAQQ